MSAMLDPDLLCPEARACFTRIQKRLREQNAWRDEYALGLAPMAAQCAAYLRDARAIAAISRTLTPEIAKKFDALLKRSQRLTRQALKQWFAALPAASLNAQGEDDQIAKLCAPLPQIVAPLEHL